jgi:flagellar assembly protein FliH
VGRIVKGAKLRVERYALAVPEIVAPALEPVLAGDPRSLGVDRDALDYDVGLPDSPLDAMWEPARTRADVDAIRTKADLLLDDAARNAEALLVDAHDRARALIEDAAARADAIAQEARTAGHAKGFAAGREDADREMNVMLETMRGLLDMAHVERRKLIEDAEPELVRLALGIAERVLHQQVALDRGVVVEMAKTAILRLIERDSVTVRVNPADLERVREHREELVALGDIRNLRIVEDQRIDRGGVVVDTDAGTIDARIRTQLDQARKILHIEDDVVIESAPLEKRTGTPGELTTARAS